jgi:hypothetical protein
VRLFENEVFRRIFGSKKDEVTEVRLHSFNSSTNLIRIITSSKMRWTGHVAHAEKDEKGTQKVSFLEILNRIYHLEVSSVDGRMI